MDTKTLIVTRCEVGGKDSPGTHRAWQFSQRYSAGMGFNVTHVFSSLVLLFTFCPLPAKVPVFPSGQSLESSTFPTVWLPCTQSSVELCAFSSSVLAVAKIHFTSSESFLLTSLVLNNRQLQDLHNSSLMLRLPSYPSAWIAKFQISNLLHCFYFYLSDLSSEAFYTLSS